MDGFAANGHAAHQESPDFSRVLQALEAIFDPRSSNTTRQDASAYLELVKQHPDAPAHAFQLALDASHPVHLRYYGLTVLEYSIKYGWEDFSADQAQSMRGWVVQLAEGSSQQGPVYVRNKIGQLWAEVAKRSWGAEWMDMDELLVRLWTLSLEHQNMVLYILETLAEDIFNRDDPVASLRGNELGKACVSIFTPTAVIHDELPGRDPNLDVRFGDEGWVKRVCELLDWCLANNAEQDERVCAVAVKALNTLRAAMPWLIPKAIVATESVNHIGRALSVPIVPLQTVRLLVDPSENLPFTELCRLPSRLSSPSTPAPTSRTRILSTSYALCLLHRSSVSWARYTSGLLVTWMSTTWMSRSTLFPRSSRRFVNF